jgi:hypothetical protein
VAHAFAELASEESSGREVRDRGAEQGAEQAECTSSGGGDGATGPAAGSGRSEVRSSLPVSLRMRPTVIASTPRAWCSPRRPTASVKPLRSPPNVSVPIVPVVGCAPRRTSPRRPNATPAGCGPPRNRSRAAEGVSGRDEEDLGSGVRMTRTIDGGTWRGAPHPPGAETSATSPAAHTTGVARAKDALMSQTPRPARADDQLSYPNASASLRGHVACSE